MRKNLKKDLSDPLNAETRFISFGDGNFNFKARSKSVKFLVRYEGTDVDVINEGNGTVKDWIAIGAHVVIFVKDLCFTYPNQN